MHDLKLVRERPEVLREAMRRRDALAWAGPLLDRAEALERERRELIAAVEEKKAERNAGTQEVARRKRAGEDAAEIIARGRALGEEIATLDARRAEAEAALDALLLDLPNVPLDDVPEGGEERNVIVRQW